MQAEKREIKVTELLLSTAEAARVLGRHQKTVERNCRSGKIPAVRDGGLWKIPASYVLGRKEAA